MTPEEQAELEAQALRAAAAMRADDVHTYQRPIPSAPVTAVTRRRRQQEPKAELNEEQRALAQLYNGPARTRYLVNAGRGSQVKLSPQARENARKSRIEAINDARMDRFKSGLGTIIQHNTSTFNDKDFNEYINEARGYSARLRRESQPARPPLTDEEKKLRRLHFAKPNVMTKPQYKKLLKSFRGVDTSAAVKNTNWLGAVPQTMKPEVYDDMVNTFGEIVGVAQMRPKFDPRLLHPASAREVFGNEGYTYDLRDMDADVHTPGTLFVTRDAYTDAYGNEIPAKVVAIGGYRLPDATAAQTERIVKDMDYFSMNPTPSARKLVNRKAFMKKYPQIYPEKTRHTGFTAVSKFIIDRLAELNITPPTGQHSKFVSLNKIDADNRPMGRLVVYRLNPVLWNTLIARAARLFTYYVVVPEIRKHSLPANASLALQALYEVSHRGDYNTAVKVNIGSNAPVNRYTIENAVISSWTKYFIYPALEKAIFRDRQVQDLITQTLNNLSNVQEIIAGMIPPALACFMNLNLPVVNSLLPAAEQVEIGREDTRYDIYQKLKRKARIILNLEMDNNDIQIENDLSDGKVIELTCSAVRQGEIDAMVDTAGGYRGEGNEKYYSPQYLSNNGVSYTRTAPSTQNLTAVDDGADIADEDALRRMLE